MNGFNKPTKTSDRAATMPITIVFSNRVFSELVITSLLNASAKLSIFIITYF